MFSLGCAVGDGIGDGTSKGSCDEGQICNSNGDCVAQDMGR